MIRGYCGVPVAAVGAARGASSYADVTARVGLHSSRGSDRHYGVRWQSRSRRHRPRTRYLMAALGGCSSFRRSACRIRLCSDLSRPAGHCPRRRRVGAVRDGRGPCENTHRRRSDPRRRTRLHGCSRWSGQDLGESPESLSNDRAGELWDSRGSRPALVGAHVLLDLVEGATGVPDLHERPHEGQNRNAKPQA